MRIVKLFKQKIQIF